MGPPISLTYNTPCPRRIGTGGVVLSLSDLFTQVAHNPVLGLTCLLVLAVVLVNGWTDAPNAIATVVTTGVLPFRRAVALAAVCNLMGVLVMTAVSATVAETIYSIADFGPDRAAALSALCAALCAIVLWAVLAWRFGVPTSESHALVAGLTGAALALPGGLDNIRAGAWGRVLLGLVLSVALGWWVGGLCRRHGPGYRHGRAADHRNRGSGHGDSGPPGGSGRRSGGRTLPAPVYAGRPSSEHHSRQDRRHSRGRLRRRGDGQPPCGCPHRPHLAVHLSRLRPAGVFVGQPLPFPPLLWYTDARYDFLTFDTGGSNHVPLRHSHL